MINRGELRLDCSDMRVASGAGCGDALPMWLAPETCNTAATEVWVKTDEANASPRQLMLYWSQDDSEGQALSRASGADVFPFFDDFSGDAVDTSRWDILGSAEPTVTDGTLTSFGEFGLQSAVYRATQGEVALRVRGRLASRHTSDVDIGFGRLDSPTSLHSGSRGWQGATALSWNESYGMFSNSADGAVNCWTIGTDNWATRWVNAPESNDSFRDIRIFLGMHQGSAQLRLENDLGFVADWTAAEGCVMPQDAPLLLVLDHSNGDAGSGQPTQTLDYVFTYRPLDPRDLNRIVVASTDAPEHISAPTTASCLNP